MQGEKKNNTKRKVTCMHEIKKTSVIQFNSIDLFGGVRGIQSESSGSSTAHQHYFYTAQD